MEFISFFFFFSQFIPDPQEVKTIEAEKRIDIENKTELIEHAETQPEHVQ